MLRSRERRARAVKVSQRDPVTHPVLTSLWRAALVGVAVCALALVGASCTASPESDAPRTTGSPLSMTPSDASVEAGFARDMIEHHAQAVDMADRIRSRTADPDLRALATDIVLTQQNQIGRMEGWLELWGLPLARTGEPMGWMGTPGSMPGMATRAQLDALDTEPLSSAEVNFLNMMIRHHQAGVDMARGVIARSNRPEVTHLAQTIVDGQLAEINAMQSMLQSRGSSLPGTTSMEGMPHG